MKETTIPKWVWNVPVASITREEIVRQLTGFRDRDGYEGVMIVLWNNDHYMDEVFFEKYGTALAVAKELSMKITIWDENGFPSGYAGGLLEEKYPEAVAKQLNMEEFILEKGVRFTFSPGPNTQGVVLLNTRTGVREELLGEVDITPKDGNWKVMVFSLAQAGYMNGFGKPRKLVDYLDAASVKKFISLTHEAYYQRFAEYFGETIVLAFYDEPSFWHVAGGRIWTADFAKKFMKKHGFSPVTLYPALWEDIGEETAWARKLLFNFRSELYETEYIGTLAAWCEAHNIELTGHQDQEEIANPTPICGDLMKAFSRQHMPGVDEISFYGRGSAAYKIVSSAAKMYGKQRVMCEVFGAMGEEMDEAVMMREALDMLAKGINFFVGHGTWYSNAPDAVTFPPELSFRSKKFAAPTAEFNRFVKACAQKLAGGRQVCDLAVLYPIDDLTSDYNFTYPDAYQGGYNPPHANYMELGEFLIYEMGQDFCFIHPDFIDQCEEYKAVYLPGMKTISVATLKALLAYKNRGGIVLSGGRLPEKSVEPGGDGEVKSLLEQIFAGGKNYNDINFQFQVLRDKEPENGHLSWIHKRDKEKDVYFIANSSDTTLNLTIKIAGREPLYKTISPLSGMFLEM